MTVQGVSDPRFDHVRTTFGRLFDGPIRGGGALCVYENGVPVVDIWGGTSDRRGKRPWAPSTGAMLYSASKGLSAIVVHRLADRGLIDYDEPVAKYWSEFAGSNITVRKLMLHRGGLSQLRGIASHPGDLLDHELMHTRLAMALPDRHFGAPAYHALTFGWLMSGLAGAVTGKSMRELWVEEIAEPLGTDELGRDMLSRLIYGGRLSLEIGVLAALLTTAIGIVVVLITLLSLVLGELVPKRLALKQAELLARYVAERFNVAAHHADLVAQMHAGGRSARGIALILSGWRGYYT